MDEVNTIKANLLAQQNEYSKAKIYIITILSSLILLISMTGQGIVIPIFPLYIQMFGGGDFQLGLLIAVFSLSSFLVAPLIGSWADHYGRKVFIVIGLLGFAIANLLYATAHSFNELLLYRIIEGCTAVGTGAIVNALLIDVIPQNRRAQFLGFANGSGFIGVFVGPLIGGLLVSNGDIALPFEVSALVALVGMVLAIIILPNDFSKFKKKHKEKVIEHLSFKDKINFTNWLLPGATLVFVIVISIRFVNLMAWTLIQPIVPLYLYSLQYTALDVGIFFSSYGFFMFIGQILLGGLSDKFGRKIILQIGIVFYLAGYLTMINATQINFFFIAGALNGIGLSLIVPSVVALLADLTNSITHRGKVMAIYYNAFYFAGFLGPIFGGLLGDASSFGFVLTISIVIIFCAFLLSFGIKSVTHTPPLNINEDPISLLSHTPSSDASD